MLVYKNAVITGKGLKYMRNCGDTGMHSRWELKDVGRACILYYMRMYLCTYVHMYYVHMYICTYACVRSFTFDR